MHSNSNCLILCNNGISTTQNTRKWWHSSGTIIEYFHISHLVHITEFNVHTILFKLLTAFRTWAHEWTSPNHTMLYTGLPNIAHYFQWLQRHVCAGVLPTIFFIFLCQKINSICGYFIMFIMFNMRILANVCMCVLPLSGRSYAPQRISFDPPLKASHDNKTKLAYIAILLCEYVHNYI